MLKVMRQETPEWIKDTTNPLVAPVDKGLFGSWEGNWVAWNTGARHHAAGQRGQGHAALPDVPARARTRAGASTNWRRTTSSYTISARELTA